MPYQMCRQNRLLLCCKFSTLMLCFRKADNMNDPASCGEGQSFLYLAELCDKETSYEKSSLN